MPLTDDTIAMAHNSILLLLDFNLPDMTGAFDAVALDHDMFGRDGLWVLADLRRFRTCPGGVSRRGGEGADRLSFAILLCYCVASKKHG